MDLTLWHARFNILCIVEHALKSWKIRWNPSTIITGYNLHWQRNLQFPRLWLEPRLLSNAARWSNWQMGGGLLCQKIVTVYEPVYTYCVLNFIIKCVISSFNVTHYRDYYYLIHYYTYYVQSSWFTSYLQQINAAYLKMNVNYNFSMTF